MPAALCCRDPVFGVQGGGGAMVTPTAGVTTGSTTPTKVQPAFAAIRSTWRAPINPAPMTKIRVT